MQFHIGLIYKKLYCLHIFFSVTADVHFSADADGQTDPLTCARTEPELSTPGDPEVVGLSFKDLIASPKLTRPQLADRDGTVRKRRVAHSEIVTSSPYKKSDGK